MTAFWGWVVRMLAIIYDYDLSKLSVVPWGLVFRENFRKVSFPVTFSNVAVTGRGNHGSLESFGYNAVERSSQINLHKNGTTEAIWRKVVGSQGYAPEGMRAGASGRDAILPFFRGPPSLSFWLFFWGSAILLPLPEDWLSFLSPGFSGSHIYCLPNGFDLVWSPLVQYYKIFPLDNYLGLSVSQFQNFKWESGPCWVMYPPLVSPSCCWDEGVNLYVG